MRGGKRTRRAKRPHRHTAPLSFERLESRLAMAVVINEFVASNVDGITDQDGDRSDWIELKNTGGAPVDLAGWYLTDESANLTKWQLPTTNLPAGGYITVFASAKNRAVAGQELHTNFHLDDEGEYLGLVMTDGTTIAHEYIAYPEQKDDVSYGIGVSASPTINVDLVPDNAPAWVISPSAQNAAVDDFWREIGFNHSEWFATTTGVGYDRDSAPNNVLDPYIGTELTTGQMPSSSTRTSAYVRVPFTVTDKDQLTSLALDLRYDDGFIAYLNGKEVARRFFQEDDSRPQPQWDSRANGNRPDSTVIIPITFDLTPYLGELVNGNNVLAFHGVNSTSQNTDFLIDPLLRATRATGSVTGFMDEPTPAANNGLGVLGFVGDTHFSVDRGFYDAPIQVEIAADVPDATIRYTLDGTLPSETAGTIYSGPINVSGTTTLRAIGYKTGFKSTGVDTETYVFLDDVIQQTNADLPQFVKDAVWGHDKDDPDSLANEPDWDMDPDIVNNPTYSSTIKNDLKAIPTVSVVMDWADLFGNATLPGSATLEGIYLQGKSDERPMSMEFFTADGSSQFRIDAAIEMQGHSSTTRWNSDKMSFQLKFKSPYGPNDLNAVLFNGTADGTNAASEFDTLVLDAGYNYTWLHPNSVQNSVARYVTDQVVSDLQNLAGGQAPHGKYVHLYLNGMYWGLYNLHERPDDSFAEEYFGGDKDDYDVIKHNPAPDFTWADGGVTALNNYQALLAATQEDMTVLANYQAVEQLLDVDDFIDYMIVHYYAANNDWAHNNWYASRNRVEPGAKWHFHAWDQEHAFPTNDNGDSFDVNYDPTTKDDPSAPTGIHNDLMASPEYKLRFADHVQKLMQNGGILTSAKAQAVYQARVTEIDRAIVGESARWGDNRFPTDAFTRSEWVTITNNLVANFFPARTTVSINQFTARGWLSSLAAPTFNNYGGQVSPGFDVTITKPVGSPGAAEIYYTTDGSDPRLVGGNANPAALHGTGPLTVDIDVAKQIKARIKNGSTWSPIIDATFTLPDLFPVRITELHYHPAEHPGVTDSDDLEFIELLNTGSQTVSLTGVQIAEFATPSYTFGAGVNLNAGQRIIVARNPAVFQSVYGNSLNVAAIGYGGANLSNGGERIVLLGPLGETLQDFSYDDVLPWPTAADGGGSSLEIIDPVGDPTLAGNWRASFYAGGSPGTDGAPPPPLAGDYDGSDTVDEADYGVWMANFGATVTPGSGADGNTDGTIDLADYIVWRKNLGATQGPAVGNVAAATAVNTTDLGGLSATNEPNAENVDGALLTAVDDAFSGLGTARPADWSASVQTLPSKARGGDLLLLSLAGHTNVRDEVSTDIVAEQSDCDNEAVDQLLAEWAGV